MSLGVVQGVVLSLGRSSAKCPVGAMAHHPRYGVCEVVAAIGLVRTLEVVRHLPLRAEDMAEDTLYDEIIESEWIDVHVSELDLCSGADRPVNVANVLRLR